MAGRREDGADVRERLSAHQLDRLVRRLDGLGALPAIVKHLLELLSADGAARAWAGPPEARGEIVTAVAADPALAAKALSLANASSPGSAKTIEDAVAALGFEAVRSMILAARIAPWPAAGAASGSGMNRPEFWRHCLAVATAAELLAQRCQPPLPARELFAAGLLHDLGKLVLEHALPKSYGRVLAAAQSHSGNVADYELEMVGVDHPVVGRRLAERWRLPDSIGRAIWLHHQPIEAIPGSAADRTFIGVVGLADAIARGEGIGFSGNYAVPHGQEEAARRLGISASALAEVSGAVAGVVEERLAAAAPTAGEDPRLYQEALAAANAELGRLNERLLARADLHAAKAGAFDALGRFAAGMEPEATVADVLFRIAGVAAAIESAQPAPAQPALAYSTGDETDEVLVVWTDPDGQPESRTFARAASFDPGAAPGPDASCRDAMGALLEAPADLWERLDPSAYRHMPLVFGGRWIGGTLVPAGASDASAAGPVRDVLATVLSLSLSILQQRQRATLLSEQLAGASQRLAEAQEALAETRAMAAVGEMAAGAAHELNNPLAVVSGRAQLMQERAGTEAERKTWKLIAEQAQRVSDIVTELMAFASPPQPAPEAFDAAELLAEAAGRFSRSNHLHARSARVDISAGQDVPNALADRAQMLAVVEELIANAATAATAVPQIRLAAEGDAAGAVVVSVADGGPGMDEQTLSRVFRPFFSAQRAGRRRGLGLAKAKRTVESNGGRIWLRSRPGEGTTVYVRLPSARGQAGRRQER